MMMILAVKDMNLSSSVIKEQPEKFRLERDSSQMTSAIPMGFMGSNPVQACSFSGCSFIKCFS